MSRRLVPLLALVATLAAAAPAGAAGRAASVTLDKCSGGATADERFAVFTGRMRAVPGADRLELRFVLQQRAPEPGRWRTVAGDGLGEWLSSAPGVGAYVFTKRVERLGAPASVRTVVHFRWIRADGVAIARARRVSAVCRQADRRPDLRPVWLEGTPLPDGLARYRVGVRNGGAGSSGASDLSLAVDGRPQPTHVLPAIPAGRVAVVELVAPACTPGSVVRALADPAGTVAERDEDDNGLGVSCPLG